MAGFAAATGKRPAEPAAEPCCSGSSRASSPSSCAAPSPLAPRPPPPKRQVASSSSSPPPPQAGQEQIQDQLPIVPTLVTTSSTNYGRINAENETNLSLLEGLPDHRATHHRIGTMSGDSRVVGAANRPLDTIKGNCASQQQQQQEKASPMGRPSQSDSPLVALPSELVHGILSRLSVYDLAAASATCRALRKHAISDFHWHRCVQRNVPGQAVAGPGPCASYRELYAAHDRLWFLPKYKIWFCDQDLMGKLVVVRYDQRRGCIEGYQLLAVSNRTTFEHWPADHQVIIHGFEPQVKLHLDKPVLQFRVRDRQEDGGFSSRPGANRCADEMPMALEERMGGMFSNFLLTRPLGAAAAEARLAAGYPYGNVWPPPTIPAHHHVSGSRSGHGVVNLSPDDRPRSRREVSDQTFRIRQWMEMAGTPAPPGLMGQAGGFAGMVQVLTGLSNAAGDVAGPAAAHAGGATGIHIGEEVITYSTLDPVLYTPTPTKPWRGIWVGDYSGHGCEFLLINQPDDPPATDAELGLVRRERETDGEWEQRRLDARMYRGRLEAIKLTGDPNVPRGEYTFVADDLGPAGYVGVATDAPFVGARVVQSKGHVAATGFVGVTDHLAHALTDKYIESQLLLISPNRLAQYWVGFGHISFFERVCVDDFVVP
ncbi:hypothetical protein TOPH_01989 [Tolypocladium ophioglossoides CBS 100239]|uniref:F-box domain-containing protein n=1 Tax=Tolypocladium ophioglossoides (strain CBS 100239) TaxID=1163406 RepID=A0A0L0NIM7_TOLOC|nr:hypothetical protein TOPH_01989 [Tolypocladium ophioglossoides CBS 100239]